MNRLIRLTAGVIFLALFLLGFQSSAFAADTDKCTAITSLPATISASGVYCLTSDLGTNTAGGFAITITADDVTLDLGGHSLSGLAGGTTTNAYGIYALDHKNITIRNGTVRGFAKGIDLDDSGGGASRGHLVEYVRLETINALAITVNGSGSVIRNNQILNTNGRLGLASIAGIYAGGTGIRVLNNDIEDITVAGASNSYAIWINPTGNGAVVEGNQISNISLPIAKDKGSFGIIIDGSTDVLVVNNRITVMNFGVYFNTGAGKYRDNLTSGVGTPYSGGTDAGNNN
jgi:hypothetical protein